MSSTQEYVPIILETISQIPYGKVASYGQIAHLSGLPRHARFVGKLLSGLNADTEIPWHRVVNAQGRISCQGLDDTGMNRQVQLLQQEGVAVLAGKINMKLYQWQI